MPVLLAYAIEVSPDIFGISGGGGFEHPPPRYARGHAPVRVTNQSVICINTHKSSHHHQLLPAVASELSRL